MIRFDGSHASAPGLGKGGLKGLLLQTTIWLADAVNDFNSLQDSRKVGVKASIVGLLHMPLPISNNIEINQLNFISLAVSHKECYSRRQELNKIRF
jgi:hypothetical protein